MFPGCKKLHYDEELLDCAEGMYVRVGNILHFYHSGQLADIDKEAKVLRVIVSKLESNRSGK